jgi:hypothetical protein
LNKEAEFVASALQTEALDKVALKFNLNLCDTFKLYKKATKAICPILQIIQLYGG